MRLAWLALASLLFFSTIPVADAQQQSAWTPRAIEALQSTASSKTGFSFDHWMLVLASKAVPGDDDLRRVIAGVSGLSVRIYRFQDAGYDLAALTSANDEYRAAGWQRVIEKHETSQGSGVTDVWVRMENNAIANAALLVARPNEVILSACLVRSARRICPISAGTLAFPASKAALPCPRLPSHKLSQHLIGHP